MIVLLEFSCKGIIENEKFFDSQIARIGFIGKSKCQKHHCPDVRFISVLPLKTVVYWKPTHACSYLPWHANAPRHTRESWVFGEYLRYIRICSHEYLYDSCCKRLQAALVWWGYPQRVLSEKYIEWTHRGKYMMTRAQRLRELEGGDMHTQDTVVATLSQVESQVNAGNDALGAVGGGRELQRTVHVLRTLHHGGIQMAWARATHVLQRRLKFIPRIRLFTILKPAKNLCRIFRARAHRTPAADDSQPENCVRNPL